jgi:hypothetical protein
VKVLHSFSRLRTERFYAANNLKVVSRFMCLIFRAFCPRLAPQRRNFAPHRPHLEIRALCPSAENPEWRSMQSNVFERRPWSANIPFIGVLSSGRARPSMRNRDAYDAGCLAHHGDRNCDGLPAPANASATCGSPTSGSRTRAHAFTHGTSCPSRHRRTSPRGGPLIRRRRPVRVASIAIDVWQGSSGSGRWRRGGTRRAPR